MIKKKKKKLGVEKKSYFSLQVSDHLQRRQGRGSEQEPGDRNWIRNHKGMPVSQVLNAAQACLFHVCAVQKNTSEPSYVNQQSNYPRDVPTGQSDGKNSLVECPSSWVCQVDNQDYPWKPILNIYSVTLKEWLCF